MTNAERNADVEPSHSLPQSESPRLIASPFLLSRGPYSDRPELLAVNLRQWIDSNASSLFANSTEGEPDLATRIVSELDLRRDRATMMLFGPEIDPFAVRPDLQREMAAAARVLADRGIISWFSTRSVPSSEMLEFLTAHRDRVRVTVSLTTLDEKIQHAIEPDASSAIERLEFISELHRRQIPLEVNLDPIVLGLTDTHDQLWNLFERLSSVGVQQVTAGYLVLRPGMRERLEKALESLGVFETVMGGYFDGITMRDGPNAAALYLTKAKRQRGYAALMSLGSEFEIVTRLSSLANPDFRGPRPPDALNSARARMLIQRLRESPTTIKAVGA